MRIAIVGAGRIGGNAARLWSRADHDVVICLSRHPDQLAARAGELGDQVSAASPAHAVAIADVVMLAVPWGAIDQALADLGSLAGSVVVDATNAYGPGPGRPRAKPWPRSTRRACPAPATSGASTRSPRASRPKRPTGPATSGPCHRGNHHDRCQPALRAAAGGTLDEEVAP